MDAATQGALQAGKPVGGFKIGREAGEWTTTNFHPYLPSENYLTCRYRQHQMHDFSYVLRIIWLLVRVIRSVSW